MKRLLLFVVTLCLATQASAGILPTFKFGVKGGWDYQTNNLSSVGNIDFKSNSGWYAGVQGDLSWGGLGIHPEVIYSHNKFGVSDNAATTAMSVGDVKMSKLDIPVLLQLKLLGVLALQAGPTFCVMTNTEGSVKGSEWNIDRPTISYALGAELRLWKLGISARYNGSFKRSEVLGYTTGKNRINSFQVGLGYYF